MHCKGTWQSAVFVHVAPVPPLVWSTHLLAMHSRPWLQLAVFVHVDPSPLSVLGMLMSPHPMVNTKLRSVIARTVVIGPPSQQVSVDYTRAD